MKVIFSCEHGGNTIPEKYQRLFVNAEDTLNSHRGLDYGTLDLFKYCESLSDFSISNTISRLLIEVNRSIHHPKLFSEFTSSLSIADKSKIIHEFYNPYRDAIEAEILKLITKGEEIVHISFHSFTPNLNDTVRRTDIGLLYDPSKTSEKTICKKWKELLVTELPDFKIRFNYPYLGKADGFTTYLRKKFPYNYYGIELEINQKFSEENIFKGDIKTAIYNSILALQILK